ncbi:MAG: alpha/beta hydrolase [Lachnospiraceae bacterium]|nr:alpha/beta hydrolase [Lachnospiraceae bacterium]
MFIHEFVNGSKPVMVLIHGVLTPWQIWTPQIEAFKEKYNIYVVALNAHTKECASEFISVDAEADEIIEYFKSKNIDTIDVLSGISLGGKISFKIFSKNELKINNLIMDGAPLVACPNFAVKFMIKSYKDIIHKSKIRDAKVIANFKKHFLPEKYLEEYLKIADNMSDSSIENIVTSVCEGGKIKGINTKSRILFIHGTKGNEILSKKTAKLVKKYYTDTKVICFKGDAHVYKAIYQPEIWIETVSEFLEG